MSESLPPADLPEAHKGENLPAEALERIDRLCREFEKALRNCEGPRIEDYLAVAVGLERKQLLRKLLVLERQHPQPSGATTSLDHYSMMSRALRGPRAGWAICVSARGTLWRLAARWRRVS